MTTQLNDVIPATALGIMEVENEVLTEIAGGAGSLADGIRQLLATNPPHPVGSLTDAVRQIAMRNIERVQRYLAVLGRTRTQPR
jgi:hypothetical protein